jgi:hypothetical protein
LLKPDRQEVIVKSALHKFRVATWDNYSYSKSAWGCNGLTIGRTHVRDVCIMGQSTAPERDSRGTAERGSNKMVGKGGAFVA